MPYLKYFSFTLKLVANIKPPRSGNSTAKANLRRTSDYSRLYLQVFVGSDPHWVDSTVLLQRPSNPLRPKQTKFAVSSSLHVSVSVSHHVGECSPPSRQNPPAVAGETGFFPGVGALLPEGSVRCQSPPGSQKHLQAQVGSRIDFNMCNMLHSCI